MPTDASGNGLTDALDTTDARADIPKNGQTDAIGNGPTDALDTTDARADIPKNGQTDAIGNGPTDALDTTDARADIHKNGQTEALANGTIIAHADISKNGQTDAVGNGTTDALDTTDARADIPKNGQTDAVGNGPADAPDNDSTVARGNDTEYSDELEPADIPGNASASKFHRQFKDLFSVKCYSAFRHKDNAPPELIAKANQLGIKDRERGDANETRMCFGRGCQTLICYENGWAIYAMKHCLTRAEDGCDYHIGTFCAKGHPVCLNCDEKDLCNDKYIELPVVIRIESIAITNGANHHLHASLLPTALALLLLLIGAILCMNAL
ncbi:hypothetical protein niasHS_013845 [Heterodera schachtii]|uniref:Uncharacterized protein n=1 Tax=Heterodera schachtii TaxID=97005 RepID=A0ABD2IL68_HETSC